MLLRAHIPFGVIRAAAGVVRGVAKWAYHAVQPSKKRTNPTSQNRSEDAELTPTERAQLLAAGRELHRNFALVGWAVRKHLDYVSTFTFQGKIADETKNAQLEAFVAKWSHKDNFDIARRHDLRRFTRLAEARRTVDGDVFIVKLANGKVQAVEADRIRSQLSGMPNSIVPDPSRLIHGVYVDEWGAAEQYCLYRRSTWNSWIKGPGTFQFERMLDAKWVYHHAYYDRFDQTRGISPLASVYNALVDLYESWDYALAKMKISQLLGLVITRAAADSMGETIEPGTEDDDQPKYNVKLEKDPFKLELDPGDDAKFIDSKNPSSEFQQFSQTMIMLVLKAFDIPYSFYAENFSNYSGSRQALLQYEQSADSRRAENRDMLNDLTAWRVAKAIEEGDPDLAGIELKDLRWEWVSSALPWIDPLKEVTAQAAAVDRGFTSTPQVCKEQGRDAYEVAKEQADYELKVKTYRESLGLPGIPASNPVTYTELVAHQGGNNATAA